MIRMVVIARMWSHSLTKVQASILSRVGARWVEVVSEECAPGSIHVAGSDPYDLNRDGDGVAFIDRGGRSPTLLIEEVALRPTLQDLKLVGFPALQLKERVAVLDIHQARWSTRQASTAVVVQHRIRCQPRLRGGEVSKIGTAAGSLRRLTTRHRLDVRVGDG